MDGHLWACLNNLVSVQGGSGCKIAIIVFVALDFDLQGTFLQSPQLWHHIYGNLP